MIRKEIKIFTKQLLILINVLLIVMNLSSCISISKSDEAFSSEIIVCNDISFVEYKFPKLKGVESVEYVYREIGDRSNRGIGLQPKEFRGMIFIDNNYAKEIYEKYKWEEEEIEWLSFSGETNKIKVLYSGDFNERIHTSSFVGEFYFNTENNCLYFSGEY